MKYMYVIFLCMSLMIAGCTEIEAPGVLTTHSVDAPPSSGKNPAKDKCPNKVEYSGKKYRTVEIGEQCWLAENLDVGTMVPGAQNQADNGIIEKYCYNNDPAHCEVYGGLYQWNEAMQYTTIPGARGICPPGWHIPALTEFQTLSINVGGDGNSLKVLGQGSGDGAGTNTSGFSSLLGGYYDSYSRTFGGLGSYTWFWSSSERNSLEAWSMLLSAYDSFIVYPWPEWYKSFGASVRCLKD